MTFRVLVLVAIPDRTFSNDPADIAPGTCEVVATAGAGAGFLDADTVKSAETAAPATAVLDSIVVEDAKFSNQGAITVFLGTDVSFADRSGSGPGWQRARNADYLLLLAGSGQRRRR